MGRPSHSSLAQTLKSLPPSGVHVAALLPCALTAGARAGQGQSNDAATSLHSGKNGAHYCH